MDKVKSLTLPLNSHPALNPGPEPRHRLSDVYAIVAGASISEGRFCRATTLFNSPFDFSGHHACSGAVIMGWGSREWDRVEYDIVLQPIPSQAERPGANVCIAKVVTLRCNNHTPIPRSIHPYCKRWFCSLKSETSRERRTP